MKIRKLKRNNTAKAATQEKRQKVKNEKLFKAYLQGDKSKGAKDAPFAKMPNDLQVEVDEFLKVAPVFQMPMGIKKVVNADGHGKMIQILYNEGHGLDGEAGGRYAISQYLNTLVEAAGYTLDAEEANIETNQTKQLKIES